MREAGLLWWHEGGLIPISPQELKERARSGRLTPDTLNWTPGSEESFPASWHLDLWVTHPEAAAAEPRSLIEIYQQHKRGEVTDDTLIWFEEREKGTAYKNITGLGEVDVNWSKKEIPISSWGYKKLCERL